MHGTSTTTRPRAAAIFAVVASASALALAGAAPQGGEYDCPMRELAVDYVRDVVLGPWARPGLARTALGLVSHGIIASECNITASASASTTAARSTPPAAAATAAQLYVSTTGSDTNDGASPATALASIKGAQEKIRSLYVTPVALPRVELAG